MHCFRSIIFRENFFKLYGDFWDILYYSFKKAYFLEIKFYEFKNGYFGVCVCVKMQELPQSLA